ncbi:MAG: fibrobacter succinogenes major paralogous domain-containing protein [Fibrobacter sp.]|nr:fibrobacter succinogenes major paralogous domain-containing protein [Fibrobacter sp.]
MASPCKTDQVDTCVYGELTDSRDSQTYKTVSIGTQTWMAENLNYEMDDSYCFNDDTINCAKYGRLYGADAAMATVCPSGWHLPDWVEWEILIAAVGRISKTAGGMLKSQTGWDFDRNGTDAFGFSAIPAGRRSLGYKNSESSAFFWSSEKNGIMLEYELSSVIYRYEVWVPYEKSIGAAYSVRCIQD